MRRLTLLVLALALVSALVPGLPLARAETGSYWTGEYFTNRDLAGTPIHVRIDNTIAFDWGGDSPVPGVVPADNFSARWTGPQQFDAGTYTFTATVDDGVRVYIDDVLIIDAWYGQLRTTHTADYTLTAGTHWVRVEYFDLGDQAAIFFSWREAGALNAAGGWAAEYYNNRDLNPPQVGGRLEAAIDYNWGGASPLPGVNADNFSVRWWGFPNFEGGTYQFVAGADDGVRVIVDATTVIDAWEPSLYTEHTGVIVLDPGIHTVRVEYFEAGDQARIQVYWVQLSGETGGTTDPGGPTGETGVTATVATRALNVRTGPDVSNAIVARINEGEIYDVIGQNADGTWLQLTGPGFTGWASASYLLVTGDLASVPVGDGSGTGGIGGTGGATGETIVRSNASLRVRRGPGTNESRIAEFAPGETATVIGRTVDTSWLQIRLANGVEGWVSAAFVALQSGPALSSVPITG